MEMRTFYSVGTFGIRGAVGKIQDSKLRSNQWNTTGHGVWREIVRTGRVVVSAGRRSRPAGAKNGQTRPCTHRRSWRFCAWPCAWTSPTRSSCRLCGWPPSRKPTWPGTAVTSTFRSVENQNGGGQKQKTDFRPSGKRRRDRPVGGARASTHGLYVEVQHLFHERRQLGHERLVPVVLAHVSDQYGPERGRLQYAPPRHGWRLQQQR